MALPQNVKRLAEKKLATYCNNCVPENDQDQSMVGYKIRGDIITLYEKSRSVIDPAEQSNFKVAQFRYNTNKKTWSLFWSDRKERWHMHDEINPTRNIDDLLDEVDDDPDSLFWG